MGSYKGGRIASTPQHRDKIKPQRKYPLGTASYDYCVVNCLNWFYDMPTFKIIFRRGTESYVKQYLRTGIKRALNDCTGRLFRDIHTTATRALLQQGLSEPEFYGDLVYKLRKIVSWADLSDQFSESSHALQTHWISY